MSNYRDLINITDDINEWGGKAILLSALIRQGFNVPKGFVVSSKAYLKYFIGKEDTAAFEEQLHSLTNEYFGSENRFILRSSANIENTELFASCGVFNSFIFDEKLSLVENVERIWRAAQLKDTLYYLNSIGFPFEKVRLAIIVQELSVKKFTAVIQSYDIVNERDCIVVEYCKGNVNAIVDSCVDADLLYVDYSGNVIGENGGDFPKKLLSRLCSEVKQMELLCGSHVEIEAQIDESDITYIQVRKN